MNKQKMIQNSVREFILFLIGGFIYVLIEMIARGFSHWSMFILGGICFVIIGLLNEILPWEMTLQCQCLSGACIITILEFITGLIVNKALHWNVWDYSDRPLNILGQVCLLNSFYWIILSGVAIFLDDWIRYKFFDEAWPEYRITKEPMHLSK